MRFQLLDLSKGSKIANVYSQEAKFIANPLVEIGEPIYDTDRVICTIRGLGTVYQMLSTTLISGPLFFFDLRSKILTFDQRNPKSNSGVNNGQALIMVNSRYGGSRGNSDRGGGGSRVGWHGPSSSRGNRSPGTTTIINDLLLELSPTTIINNPIILSSCNTLLRA